MKKLTVSLLCLVSFLLLACHDAKKTDNKPSNMTDFEEVLTQQDSDQVAKLIDEYFQLAINGRYYDAAAMLYRTDDDHPQNEPLPLETEQIEKVAGILQTMPPMNYRIQYMKFNEEHLNEVMCDVIIAEAQGNIPEIKTKMTFMPIRYIGNWVLTVPDFETGKHTIVNGDERDSVREAYENLEYEKKEAKRETEE